MSVLLRNKYFLYSTEKHLNILIYFRLNSVVLKTNLIFLGLTLFHFTQYNYLLIPLPYVVEK